MPSPSSPAGRPRRLIPVLAGILALLGLLSPVSLRGPGLPEAEALSACGAEHYLHGIDVSFYQGEIDWPAVAASGIDFGLARIADGLTFPDATFRTNYAGMRANGITPGSYLFWEPRQDPVAQANVVVAALAGVGFDIGDLPPVIDVEVTGGQPPATLAARLRTTVTTIEDAIGVAPFIYAAPNTWNRIVNSADFGDLPLWVAHWLVGCPSMPMGWEGWSLWQWSSSGFVPGIGRAVDLDQSVGPSLPVYTGAPVFPALADVRVHALGPTTVSYPVRAVGYRGAAVGASCQPSSGSLFRLGTSAVTCSARNVFGTTSRSFRVSVSVPTPPAFGPAVPGTIETTAAGPSGTSVTWDALAATDYSGVELPASCLPASGSLFPVGQSLVTCKASDSFGQQVAAAFTVSVGYRFVGLLPPVVDPITSATPASQLKAGALLPIRFSLAYADGSAIDDASAADLAASCGATIWLVPVEETRLGVAGGPTGDLVVADSAIHACGQYDPSTRQITADVPTTGAAPGDYTIVVSIANAEAGQLAGHVAQVTLR